MEAKRKQQVLAEIRESELVQLTRQLVQCPSVNPPGNEQRAAEVLQDFFRLGGIDVQLQPVELGRPNLIAELKFAAPGPKLLFNGHLDVVPPGDDWTVDPFGGQVSNGRLYGRGACDMKGPVAAVAEAMQALGRAEVPLRGSVVLAAVAGEEVDQCGTRKLVEDNIQADWAICAEPTQLVPIVAHKGEIYFDITIIGKAAHGSVPELGVNAIAKAIAVLSKLMELDRKLSRQWHPLCGRPTMNPGTIQGGTITSAVPDRCTISMDRRLLPGESYEQARAEVTAVLEEISRDDPQLQYEISTPLICPPMEISEDEPVVASLRRQVQDHIGKDPGVGGWSAACDATLLTNHGIPTCIFGPGDLDGQAHKADEHILISDLVQGAEIYALTILDLLQSENA